MLVNLGKFGLEVGPAPRPGAVLSFRLRPPPRRWWVFGPRLTPEQMRARWRNHRRRMRRANRISLEVGPLALRLYLWDRLLASADSYYGVEVQGSGINALVEAEEWTTAPTRVVWVPWTRSDVLRLHLRAQRLDGGGGVLDPAGPRLDLVLERAPIANPPRRVPLHRTDGFPSVIELPLEGFWRFEARWGEHKATLTAWVEPP